MSMHQVVTFKSTMDRFYTLIQLILYSICNVLFLVQFKYSAQFQVTRSSSSLLSSYVLLMQLKLGTNPSAT